MSRDSALARALRATVERDDWFAVEALLADAATLHVPGRSGLSGPYRGRDAIHALLDKLGALGEGMFGFEPERIAVDRNLTIVLGRFVCRSGTAVQHTPAVLACETSRGQVVDVRVFPDGRAGLHLLDR